MNNQRSLVLLENPLSKSPTMASLKTEEKEETKANDNTLINKIDFCLASYYLANGLNDYLDSDNNGKFFVFCENNKINDQDIIDLCTTDNNDYNTLKFTFDNRIPKALDQSSLNNDETAIYLIRYIFKTKESPLCESTWKTNPTTRNIVITQNYMIKAFNSIESALNKLNDKMDLMSDKIENITNNKSKYGVQSCDVCRFPDMPQDGRKFCSDKCKEYFLNREETKEDK